MAVPVSDKFGWLLSAAADGHCGVKPSGCKQQRLNMCANMHVPARCMFVHSKHVGS
jgi:hypothetical protein